MDDEAYELRARDAYACVGSMVVTVELTHALLRAGVLTPEQARPVLERFDEILEGWDAFAPVVVGKARRLRGDIRAAFRV